MSGYAAAGAGLQLLEEASYYARLLEESGGSLAIAAWHLARAKMKAAGFVPDTPTPVELRAAAVAIAAATALAVPPTAVLVADARAESLDVVGP